MKIKNLDAIVKKLNKSIDEFGNDTDIQKRIAKKMQDQYRENIREGYDVNDQTFPALSDKTIQNRARLKKAGNRTTKSYGLTKSNLTFTGELVQSIYIKFMSYSRKRMSFEIEFRGAHKKYKTLSGQSKSNESTILEIATGLLDKGFDLFGFPNRKISNVSATVSQLFKRYLKRK